MFSFHICFIYVNFTCANVKYILHTCKLFLAKYKISGDEIQKVTGQHHFRRHHPDGHTGQAWREVPLWRVRS